jgi:hypothetical protein
MTRTKRTSPRLLLFSLLFLGALLSLVQGSAAHNSFVGAMNGDPGYIATIMTTTEPPFAGRPQTLIITLINAAAGVPVTDLDIVHEKKMHVFIVGEDLRTFRHMHPDDFPDGFSQADQGAYLLRHTFARPGNYAIVFEATTEGKNLLYLMPERVIGEPSEALVRPPDDFSRSKIFPASDGEYAVTLRAPKAIVVGQETQFDFYIQRDGKDVTDIGMLYGAEIHVLVIRDDFRLAGHTHTYVPGHSMIVGDMQQRYSGPVIPTRYTFPEPGTYAVFGQFQRQGTIVTTQFLVRVDAYVPPSATEQVASDWRAHRVEIGLGLLVLVAAIALVVWSRKRKG